MSASACAVTCSLRIANNDANNMPIRPNTSVKVNGACAGAGGGEAGVAAEGALSSRADADADAVAGDSACEASCTGAAIAGAVVEGWAVVITSACGSCLSKTLRLKITGECRAYAQT